MIHVTSDNIDELFKDIIKDDIALGYDNATPVEYVDVTEERKRIA